MSHGVNVTTASSATPEQLPDRSEWAAVAAGPLTEVGTVSGYLIEGELLFVMEGEPEKYGFEPAPTFMLAEHGRVVADDGTDRYIVTTKQRDFMANTFVEQLHGWRKAAARLIRIDGAYLRFAGS